MEGTDDEWGGILDEERVRDIVSEKLETGAIQITRSHVEEGNHRRRGAYLVMFDSLGQAIRKKDEMHMVFLTDDLVRRSIQGFDTLIDEYNDKVRLLEEDAKWILFVVAINLGKETNPSPNGGVKLDNVMTFLVCMPVKPIFLTDAFSHVTVNRLRNSITPTNENPNTTKTTFPCTAEHCKKTTHGEYMIRCKTCLAIYCCTSCLKNDSDRHGGRECSENFRRVVKDGRKIRRKMRPCHMCKRKNARFRCGGCESYYYCSKKCQMDHWDSGGHRRECKRLGKLRIKLKG